MYINTCINCDILIQWKIFSNKKEFLINTTKWINLKNIMLGEIKQTQKNVHYTSAFT